jgi:nucleoside 2-deoxyribosyltransferase
MRIYLAGPLFSLAERRFNEDLAEAMRRLCPTLEVFLPQQCDGEFLGHPEFHAKVYDRLLGELDECDAVVAVLDGSDADSGTCIEIGYARGRGKTVVGVRTDFRGSEVDGLNLMVAHICSRVLAEPSTTGTLERLGQRIVEALSEGMRSL